jgi:peptidoglycan/LPS O-acetylase OafA/YrhL
MATHTATDVEPTSIRREGHRHALAFQSSLARSAKYRADVDGLRAVAVLAVIFFHAKLLQCAGGYVGVDVFFVISGYLITSLVARDIVEGKFSFVTFYERRIRRIFPALFGVLFFSAAAACVLLAPQDLTSFGRSLVATTLFVSNVHFWHTAQPLGYFSNKSVSEALLHTWSLAVEEQFYLAFPIVLVILFRWTGKWTNVSLLLLSAASFGLNVWCTYHKPIAAFYFAAPRAWELLIGALLANRAFPALRHRSTREAAAALGLVLIITAIFTLSPAAPFPGFSALLPCLGAWFIVYAGESGASATKTLLSFRPLVFIGVISYSLYLWHWPFLVFSRYFVAGELSSAETTLVLVTSAVIAFLSFEFIERPFRGTASCMTRNQVFRFALAASLLSTGVGITAWITQGLPQRYSAQTHQLIAENAERETDYDDSCANWRTQIHNINDIRFCSLGTDSPRKIMFWGDSHVEQLYPAARALYNKGDLNGQGVLFAVANGCLPAESLNSVGGFYCDSFSKFALARAQESDIGTVFIGFNTWWYSHDNTVCASVNDQCTKILSPEETTRRFLHKMFLNIRTLRNLGKRVIVCLPFPMYDKSIPQMEIRNAVFGRFGLGGKATDFTSPVLRTEIRSMALNAGAEVFDPRAMLCPLGSCLIASGGVSMYIDGHHLAASQVGIFDADLQKILR